MTLQDNNQNSLAGCVIQNLGFVYIKKSDFDRFMRVILSCGGINPSQALYGCVICALTNVETVSLHFIDVVQVFNNSNFGVISDISDQFWNIQNLNLEDSLVENFWYRQSRKFCRRATKKEIFQTLQRIIKLDGFERFCDVKNSGDVKWLQKNLFEYDDEIDFEFGKNGKLSEEDILGLEAEEIFTRR